MSGTEVPLRVVTISPIDYDRAPNNRDHNLVRVLVANGCEVTHLYQALNRSTRPLDLLRDSLTASVRARAERGVRLVRVDPFFNYYAGFRARSDHDRGGAGWGRGLARAAVLLLSPLACLRDICFLPCFLVAALTQVRGRHDVCLGFGPWGGLVGWWLRALGRVRLLVIEDRDFEPGLLPDRFRRSYTGRVDRFVVRRADLVFSVGHRLGELRRRQGARAVHVIPNGVAWERFERARTSARRGRTLFYTGNLVPWSGLELVLRALPELRADFPDLRLRVVGDGPPGYRESLARLARELDLADRVEWLGPRPHAELPALMEGAAIGLACSEPVPFRSYACPLKVLEYMAAGLPVIGTSDTETEALIERFECGLAVPFEIEAFAAAAGRLLSDPALHARLRANGIRRAADLTWERLIGEELGIIARATPGPAAGPSGARG